MANALFTEEHLLDDEKGWKSEAEAVIADISAFVSSIAVSSQLPCDQNGVYLNVETKERNSYTVEMSSGGFRVCGNQFDSQAEANEHTIYYETPYALLDSISPAYRECFGAALAFKLQQLLANE